MKQESQEVRRQKPREGTQLRAAIRRQEGAWIDSIISKFFPMPKKLYLEPGTRQYRQVRALTVLLLMITLVCGLSVVFISVALLFTEYQLQANVWFGLAVFSMMALQVWGFYRFENARISSTLLSLSYFMMALVLVLISGGIHSPNIVILLTCPVISYRVGGKDEGTMNTIFSGFAIGVLFIADWLEIPVLNIFMRGMDHSVAMLIAWVAALTIVASCLATYDIDE